MRHRRKAEKFFFTCHQQKHSKDSQAASLEQAHSAITVISVLERLVFFRFLPPACGQELQACHRFPRSHHWLG